MPKPLRFSVLWRAACQWVGVRPPWQARVQGRPQDQGRRWRRGPHRRAFSRFLPGYGQSGRRSGQQVLFVDLAKSGQELRLVVEARAHTVEHGRDVLAHRRPVGAAAQEGVPPARERGRSADDGKAPLKQLDERIDAAGVILANRFPAGAAHRGDVDLHLVEGRTADAPIDFSRVDLQVDDRTVADAGLAGSAIPALGKQGK